MQTQLKDITFRASWHVTQGMRLWHEWLVESIAQISYIWLKCLSCHTGKTNVYGIQFQITKQQVHKRKNIDVNHTVLLFLKHVQRHTLISAFIVICLRMWCQCADSWPFEAHSFFIVLTLVDDFLLQQLMFKNRSITDYICQEAHHYNCSTAFCKNCNTHL